MNLAVTLQSAPIVPPPPAPPPGAGAVAEFCGVVRGEEDGQLIAGLVYEAYGGMAESEMRRLAAEIAGRLAVLSAEVIHRTGFVPVGETAIWVRVSAPHRAEAFQFLIEFMDLLKQDVPIWKARAIPAEP